MPIMREGCVSNPNPHTHTARRQTGNGNEADEPTVRGTTDKTHSPLRQILMDLYNIQVLADTVMAAHSSGAV